VLLPLARLVVSAFILLSSLYALLAYIPFTYQQIHKGGLLPILTVFGHYQHRLYWAALALACATILPDFRARRTRWLAWPFLVVHIGAGVLLQFFPVMSTLRNEVSSYTIGMVALIPLVWIAALDLLGHAGAIQWAEYRKEDDRRIFSAAWHSALFLSLVYCCIFYARSHVEWAPSERISALLTTVLVHALIFGVLYAALNLVRSIASLTSWPSPVEFALANLLTAGIGFILVRTLVFHPISFEGAMADGYAALLALGILGALAGPAVRAWRADRGPAGGLALALAPVTLPWFRLRFLRPLPLFALGGFAWTLAVNTAIMDWNYMLQKLTACVTWVLVFAYMYTAAPQVRGVPDRRIRILFWAAMIMSGYRYTAAAAATHPKIGAALETYAGFDASFRLIRDAISAPPRDDTFYKFLSENTNIPRAVPTVPVEIDPAGPIAATPGPKPNIFILVIDSLRRDYLGAYNSAVNFTPAFDRFARESTVFRNTFTRYGGTGLAEPSIWVGGMILHKQYVTPFYPMNALAKLVEAEHYQSFVSMDPILRVVVKPTPNLVELDSDRSGMDYRVCSSLDDLQDKLDHRADPSRPAFAYTQSQDIHISVINREKNSVIDTANYGAMYAPYASRLRRADGCFGKFVDYLKARNLFDNSIVVLTADHGDSLGESGRWGHAYTLVPEVVRVPLIVHLPKQYQNLYSNPATIAFQSDITPSFYYLLGHKPTFHPEFYGRPLFTESADEQKSAVHNNYLIAASYAAVYGILGGYGKNLYVADAVNYKDAYYEITDDAASDTRYVGASQQSDAEELIRKRIQKLNTFYKFPVH
jgi:hypothetical protein